MLRLILRLKLHFQPRQAKLNGPFVLLCNHASYYDPLLEQLQRGIDEHFMGARHAEIWRVATTPEEAVDLVLSTPLWDASVRKFAAI